ncbi:MAG: hypothetical protein FWE56_03510 [Candidatus Bathyarchaeota archaeon]|nr:hypothetical protein [Candidatus Termiticorpusculum sp.]
MKTQPDIYLKRPFKENRFYLGKTQEGKTNLLAYHLSRSPNPFVVWDTVGAISKKFTPRNPHTQIIIDPEKRLPMPAGATPDIIEAVEAARLDLFHVTCQRVWDQQYLTFAVDEAHTYCSTGIKRNIDPWLNQIVTKGGNRNIGFAGTSQRVGQVHNNILANIHHFFVFRTFIPPDVDWMSKFIDRDEMRRSKDLPQFHYLYYNLDVGKAVFHKPVPKMGV